MTRREIKLFSKPPRSFADRLFRPFDKLLVGKRERDFYFGIWNDATIQKSKYHSENDTCVIFLTFDIVRFLRPYKMSNGNELHWPLGACGAVVYEHESDLNVGKMSKTRLKSPNE